MQYGVATIPGKHRNIHEGLGPAEGIAVLLGVLAIGAKSTFRNFVHVSQKAV